MGDLSVQEMIKIANGFMLNAPPGEFMEVVTDVRGLLADDSIINDTAPATFRQYNTDQMLQVGHEIKRERERERKKDIQWEKKEMARKEKTQEKK